MIERIFVDDMYIEYPFKLKTKEDEIINFAKTKLYSQGKSKRFSIWYKNNKYQGRMLKEKKKMNIDGFEMGTVMFENDLDGLRKGLRELAELDADFSGDNGIVSDEIFEKGYTSEEEYLYWKCVDETANEHPKERIKNIIKKYIEGWMGNNDYYKDYKYEIKEDEAYIFISLSFVY